jgi:hypothetical protein
MKTDKELLELAAKAAALTIVVWNGDVPLIYFDKLRNWNPLSDHSQAKHLRHACRLSNPNVKSADGGKAAYRRAIVSAAAAIGESM